MELRKEKKETETTGGPVCPREEPGSGSGAVGGEGPDLVGAVGREGHSH